MRCVFAGTPDVAATALQRLLNSSHDVVGVITRPDARAGRGRAVAESPVASAAAAAGIKVIKPASLGSADVLEWLAQRSPDVAPIVAFGGLVPRAALDIPARGWVNLHFSLLPRWRGAAPVQHAIWRGDDVTGASTFLLEEGLDTGPVYGSLIEEIGPHDSAGSLLARLADVGADLLVETLDQIESGTATAVPQVGESSYAPKLTVEDAHVRWDAPAFAVDRQVRACTPAPGAWTTHSGTRVGIDGLRPVDAVDDGAVMLGPGEIHVTKRAVLVGTLTDPVELGTVRPAGKKPMAAADWARGIRLVSGARLGDGAA